MSLTHFTSCKLCGVKFEIDAVPIIGEGTAEKAQRFVQALLKHAGEKHPERMGEIMRAAVQYQTVLVFNCFEIGDPTISDAASKAKEFALSQLTENPAKKILVS